MKPNLDRLHYFLHNLSSTSNFGVRLVAFESRHPEISNDIRFVKIRQGTKKLWPKHKIGYGSGQKHLEINFNTAVLAPGIPRYASGAVEK